MRHTIKEILDDTEDKDCPHAVKELHGEEAILWLREIVELLKYIRKELKAVHYAIPTEEIRHKLQVLMKRAGVDDDG